MKKLNVSLKERSYSIHIGGSLSDLGAQLRRDIGLSDVFLITNTTVQKLYEKKAVGSLKKVGYKVSVHAIPDGEAHKNIRTLEKLYIHASKCGINRSSIVIALGGGVVGDVAGFFAATFMRGLVYVQVPTTLLAMVDASVGGKTGFDLPTGKNLVGAFYQPKLVWIDTSVLRTLPSRQMKNGIAEIIKYGIISDKNLFDRLSRILPKWKNISEKNWSEIIYKCLKIKAGVVEKDEFEKKGLREILNFGHTFAHALETCSGYKRYLHGEAVAIGMKQASMLALKSKMLDKKGYSRIVDVIDSVGYPGAGGISPKKIVQIMKRDKKVISGKIRLVLPVKIGTVRVLNNAGEGQIKEVLK